MGVGFFTLFCLVKYDLIMDYFFQCRVMDLAVIVEGFAVHRDTAPPKAAAILTGSTYAIERL